MIPRLDFHATRPVQQALAALGRTEDVRFSPEGRLLAIAGFEERKCLFLRLRIEDRPNAPVVVADDYFELTSPDIRQVHGLDFLDERTIVVANRDAGVAILELPPGEPGGRSCHVTAAHRLRKGRFRGAATPGSVAVWRESTTATTLLVCNNYRDLVTRHLVEGGGGSWSSRSAGRLWRGLKIPDGVAVSHDGRWIAVSSHDTHDVKLFSASARFWPLTGPIGVLRGARFPHGLRFSSDDRYLLLADAGAPLVHVYERGPEGWRGDRGPLRSVPVMALTVFERGQALPDGGTNYQEGGPKGLDIDRSQRVVVTTCKEDTLAFFPLSSMTGTACEPEAARSGLTR